MKKHRILYRGISLSLLVLVCFLIYLPVALHAASVSVTQHDAITIYFEDPSSRDSSESSVPSSSSQSSASSGSSQSSGGPSSNLPPSSRPIPPPANNGGTDHTDNTPTHPKTAGEKTPDGNQAKLHDSNIISSTAGGTATLVGTVVDLVVAQENSRPLAVTGSNRRYTLPAMSLIAFGSICLLIASRKMRKTV